jgi:hypothetical protein
VIDADTLKAVYGVDPFLVECARCAAKPGDPCVALSSAARKAKEYPHPVRIHAAREAAVK